MKYEVDIKFTGYYSIEVEADDPEEAYEKAYDEWWDITFDSNIEDIETLSARVYDENGKEV